MVRQSWWGAALACACAAVLAGPAVGQPAADESAAATAPAHAGDDLFVIVVRGEIGFIDRAGKVRIPPSKRRLGPRFSEGLTTIRLDSSRWAYVDPGLRTVIPGPFEHARPFCGGRAPVQLGGRWGLIDRAGALVVPARFERIGAGCSEGSWSVRKDGVWGLIDAGGAWIIEPAYDHLSPLQDGWALASKDGAYSFVDRAGKVVLRGKGDLAWEFAEGLTPMRVRVGKGHRWGYIDRKGKLVIRARFVRAHPFSEGLAVVETDTRKGFRLGYADTRGRVVIPPAWPGAEAFSDGLAVVKVGQQFGYIDRKGKLVIPATFDSAESFDRGLARVELHRCADADRRDGVCYANRTDLVGYIDRTGAYVWGPEPKQ